MKSLQFVCILKSWQLAIFIARVVDGPRTPLFHATIKEDVLPTAQKQKDCELCMFLECLLNGRNILDKRDQLDKLSGKEKKESKNIFVISETNSRGSK